MVATMTKSVNECLTELRASVSETFDAAKTERISAPSVGDVVRQGDVYAVCIEKLPTGGKETTNRQVVPGNTQGSRHVLEGDVKLLTGVQFKAMPTELLGPAFECVGDVTMTHPEHGHKVFPAGTTWQTVYQQAYDKEVRRTRD